MLTLLKNLKVFTPYYIGKKDILIANGKIELIEENLVIPFSKVLDLNGKIAVPGFIDAHVHIIGGGGEGGFQTRTPEITIEELVDSGITTVIGCLGTDDVTRSMEDLYAKSKQLEELGITSFIYTGSYSVPVKTITGDIKKDLVLIDKVIGVGEIAISDHRSSQPTLEEIKRIVAQARVGGLISNKAGVVNFHVGNGKNGIDYLFEIAENTEIPIYHMYPTHVGRSKELFHRAIEFAKKGGFIDLTASESVVDYLEIAINEGVIDNLTMTSDGHGSLPKFDENGRLIKLDVASTTVLFESVKKAVERDLNFEEVLKTITINPAKVLKLKSKGRIEKETDGDIVVLDGNLNIEKVIARGKLLKEVQS
ncbi:isoaspartyl dipeptidase [Thermosipho africanus H17ap60334]|uniref:beta-aspartyl-peptidase n=1 Tax=Thermosipho africanus TaxID=2421 RepID=UPI00028D5305|nr:beta-aspartyl-peptidase [Thermosipho africanus]EKF48457.1 isoaspartyl dipeptidase [Thermosipho africanus H17ap60334]